MDVWYVFAPLFPQPLVALYPDEKGTSGAPPMSYDGQFGQDQQAADGQIQYGDQDRPAPGTHQDTGHDLLRFDQGDVTVTDHYQSSSRLRFFEDLTRGSRHCPR